MFIETETTPNPMSLKFLPGQQVMHVGTREFTSPEAAANSPLAQAIFDTGEVSNVMFGRDFVSVTAADRKSVVEGKSVSVREDLGGRRIIKKNKERKTDN